MNQVSQYIFNLYHFLLNVRDTAEFVIDREHPVATYNQRKDVIVKGKSQGYAFGNFLEANKEQTAKFVEKIVIQRCKKIFDYISVPGNRRVGNTLLKVI